ncbi:GIN domain-containing protein [Devosia limi]|uniref:Putative auto-transporter adhesin, head GIN domain n=1 Tax=Devosia limi DSM 17137 TaxID=1121477 RepID=A0A1M4YWC2_9HYPH|nr:DUF2807 domain-containing protein [Devosia limi]SHF09857.1 Putative auto-transporter adhesin, head GIN domain [Devosia limi DSM 17137]
MRSVFKLALAGSLGLATLGTAIAQERSFELTGFDKIDISTGLDAIVTLGDAFSVQAQSRNQQVLDKLEITVSGDTLTARIESNFLEFILGGGLLGQFIAGGNAATIRITLPALRAVNASAGADVDITAPKGDLVIDVSSGADIDITRATLGTVTVDASSGSDAELSGACDSISASASSGADIDAEDLLCETAIATASSGGHISVHATDSLEADASSGGAIEVTGNPRQTDIDRSSGGSVSID